MPSVANQTMMLRWAAIAPSLMVLTATLVVSLVPCLGDITARSGLPARPAAEHLHEEIGRILARPEYHQPEPTWLMRLVEWLTGLLRRLLESRAPGLNALYETWPLLYWSLVVVLVALLGLLLYHIFWTVYSSFRTMPTRSGLPPSRAGAPPQDLRARAAQLASEGRFTEALVALYASLIGLLDLKGLLRYDRSRTNWEYLEAVRAYPELVTAMQPLTVRLDSILYGAEPVGETEYRACEALISQAWAVGEAMT